MNLISDLGEKCYVFDLVQGREAFWWMLQPPAGGPMLNVEIAGCGRLALEHLVLDLNGTLALDGEVLPGVAERLVALSPHFQIHLLTADTRGRGAATASALGTTLHRLTQGDEAAQKRAFVESLGAERVVAVGNGANDADMLALAALGVAVVGPEGLARAAWQSADLIMPDIGAALDLLLHPQRLIATLRR
jgi:soluble P-type ATPase